MQVKVLVFKALQDHLQVVREYGDEVHSVQNAAPETLQVGRGNQAQQVLQSEEADAEGLGVLPVESAAGLT